MPIRLDHDPASDLERDWDGLAQPRLRLLGPTICEGKDCQPTHDVLHLEVRVACALEPRAGLQAEPLTLGRLTAVIGNDSEPRGRLRFDSVASKVGGELETAAELRLRGREITTHEQSCDPKLALGDEGSVLDLLRGGDGGSQAFDRVVVLTFVIRHKGREHERDLDLE